MRKLTEKQIKELDGNKCRAFGCGIRCDLEVHHIIPRRYGTDEEWNLITLCFKHHKMITDGKLTNIELLEKLIRKPDFRWHIALEWHKNRELMKKLRKEKLDVK